MSSGGAPRPQSGRALQELNVDSNQLVTPTTAGPAAKPPPPAAAAAPPSTVPDVVEDKRLDTNGNVVIRQYVKGRLLGKVRGSLRRAAPCVRTQRTARAALRAVRWGIQPASHLGGGCPLPAALAYSAAAFARGEAP